ncbi:uncharacterized protein Z518_07439 [Rhinocladiella mackenziei CBS 650.93]|uniref:Serine/threonine-protein kinase RIO1 n=1 Tax=Rhinocladiella mackenziei CBS 650.93 TaxID=1442369 RepID=A0A0D2IL07_9EURO|nr:uncharacterized protein Z518_07439 [Rhinocladiella mackenziei CBS 650.93]KIX03886.1 hypothetical protein Z518_07439 [Rhinocladiella mackenziei CBS 650.93]
MASQDMFTLANDSKSVESLRGIADGLAPSHTFIPNRGYADNDASAPRKLALGNVIHEEDGEEEEQEEAGDDDGYEYEDEYQSDRADGIQLVDPDQLAYSNPADLTKAFNRQRRLEQALADPNVPPSQYPKFNTPKLPKDVDEDEEDEADGRKPRANIAGLEHTPFRETSKDRLKKDKRDRATREQVLDPRTQKILFQMISSGIVSEINGTISAGKEANVYHAVCTSDEADTPDTHVAIKVYKTSILVFKDREKYVSGEFRFRRGFKSSDNRSMVKLWAEKELRNLKRIQAAGIPSPEPLYLRRHVLGMSFIGDSKGNAAPRLKDVEFTDHDAAAKWRAIYLEIITYMRIMLQKCKLIHADLSEYNMLYYKNTPYIIDVSQSVEETHPHSRDFLRMDIKNVNDFFRRKGVDVLSDKKIYQFLTRRAADGTESELKLDTVRAEIDKIMAQRTDVEDRDEEDEVENEVFRKQYIPQTLEEVYDAEKDLEKLQIDGRDALVYKDLLAPLKDEKPQQQQPPNSSPAPASTDTVNDNWEDQDDDPDQGAPLSPMHSHVDSEASKSHSDDADTDTGSVSTSSSRSSRPRGKRFQDKDEKREHKRKVKDEKREKRSNKIRKNVKKRLVKETSRHKR